MNHARKSLRLYFANRWWTLGTPIFILLVMVALSVQRPDRMHPAERATQQFARPGAIELRRATGMQRERRTAEPAMMVQGTPAVLQRRSHRHLTRRQLGGEIVLFGNLGVAPATWAVDLEHHCPTIDATHAIDAVLVTVQWKQPAVRLDAGLDGKVEDRVRSQPLERDVGGQAATHSGGS